MQLIRMFRVQYRKRKVSDQVLLPAVAAGATVGILLGLADGLLAARQVHAYNRNEAVSWWLYLDTAALDILVFLLLGAAYGVGRWVVPMDLGPLSLFRRVRRFLGNRGVDAARDAAAVWAALVSLVVALIVLLPLCLHFTTAYEITNAPRAPPKRTRRS